MPATRGRSSSAAKKTSRGRSRSASVAKAKTKKTKESEEINMEGHHVEDGFVVADKDFFWSDYQEPHAERKVALMKKYGPEIRKLMTIEPLTKYMIVGYTFIQLYLAVVTKTWSWPAYLACAYVIGGTVNHILFLGIHEVTHNTAFKTPFLNDLLSYVGNLPIVVPYSMMFRGYHAEHHRYQGWDNVDQDIPTPLEGRLLNSFLGKFIFLANMIFFYALRPCLARKQQLQMHHLVNWVIVGGTMTAFGYKFGWESLGYLLLSTWMAGTFHPLQGHFIAEHFIVDPKGVQETYSYYGPLNLIAWNVGYHNEHHDFPNIPWTNLPKLREIAPEYYNNLQQTSSWISVIWNFLVDPKISVRSRVKREMGAGSRKGRLIPTTTKHRVFKG